MNTIDCQTIYNSYTLNIFCDASMCGTTGCYGVVAVNRDTIIDTKYRLVSDTTSNNSEIKGVRSAISMANKWKYNYQCINIFCDSQISVFGIRDYIYNWVACNGILYGSAHKPISNQEIFLECYYMLADLDLRNIVNFYHQSGHIDCNKFAMLKLACSKFCKANKVFCKDINMIRYISNYNNYVDKTSRSFLMRANRDLNYTDPVYFGYRDPINKK